MVGGMLALTGCVAVAPVTVQQPRTITAPVVVEGVPAGMQYLYGSGEADAISRQAWRAIAGQGATAARRRPRDSVVLVQGSTLAAPRFVPCGAKPLAAVFDVDETVALNLGFERDAAAGRPYEQARWRAYEITGGTTARAVPGAVDAIRALRASGITVVFNSNRSAENAVATVAMLDRLGLGPARVGETLFLSDQATGSAKDSRRAAIAARYCVVAMAGDQLGDFSDLFNAGLTPPQRRAAADAPAIARLWGAGWFVLPNPVYGTALKGRLDEVFPADSAWAPEP
nr:HAD family acid phosphatase [Sphingomonas rubra]